MPRWCIHNIVKTCLTWPQPRSSWIRSMAMTSKNQTGNQSWGWPICWYTFLMCPVISVDIDSVMHGASALPSGSATGCGVRGEEKRHAVLGWLRERGENELCGGFRKKKNIFLALYVTEQKRIGSKNKKDIAELSQGNCRGNWQLTVQEANTPFSFNHVLTNRVGICNLKKSF